MIKELAILILGAALMWGCDSSKNQLQEYCGVYEGTLPAADAPGIKTTVSLDKAQNFTVRMVYIDKKDGDFTEKGTFSRDHDVLTFKQSNGEVTYYRIENGQLRLLNQDKEPVSGALAEHYILKKISNCD